MYTCPLLLIKGEIILHVDLVYKDLANKVLKYGTQKEDRTGTGTISLFGNQIEIDLTEGFALLTTKRVYWKGVRAETVMFLKGITNLKFLLDQDVDIWTRDAWKFYLKNKQYRSDYFYGTEDMTLDEFREYARVHGFDMGDIYGAQWCDFNREGENQLQQLENKLKHDPDSRRMKVYSANPAKADSQTLPPCHDAFQAYTYNEYIDLLFQMRSSDIFHGLPFNLASYSLIASILAYRSGYKPRRLIAQLGDTHIYLTHLDVLAQQLEREPLELPQLKLSERVKTMASISDIEIEDIELIGYNPHPSLKAPQAF